MECNLWCYIVFHTFLFTLQVKAYGPGLEKSGCIVNNPAEFFIDPKEAGTAPLSIYAQVGDIDILFLDI